jgi:putative oxidoreductase
MNTQSNAYTSALGRVLLSAIFVLSGIGKLGAAEGTIGYIASVGLPFPALGYAAALAVEIGVGLALLAGFQTRLAAAILAAFSLATAFIFHNNLGDQMQMIHFMKNIAIAGGLLHVMSVAQAGFGVDALRAGRHAS